MRIQLFILLASFVTLPAMGAEQSPPGAGRCTPPPEAIAACKDKHEGDSVSFTSPRGETITGKCKRPQALLVAVPDHPPQCGDGDKRQPR